MVYCSGVAGIGIISVNKDRKTSFYCNVLSSEYLKWITEVDFGRKSNNSYIYNATNIKLTNF